MSKRVLETLFNSRARVRLLKFLFRNYPKPFTLNEITKHLQEKKGLVKKEIGRLWQIGLLTKAKGNSHGDKKKAQN